MHSWAVAVKRFLYTRSSPSLEADQREICAHVFHMTSYPSHAYGLVTGYNYEFGSGCCVSRSLERLGLFSWTLPYTLPLKSSVPSIQPLQLCASLRHSDCEPGKQGFSHIYAHHLALSCLCDPLAHSSAFNCECDSVIKVDLSVYCVYALFVRKSEWVPTCMSVHVRERVGAYVHSIQCVCVPFIVQ